MIHSWAWAWFLGGMVAGAVVLFGISWWFAWLDQAEGK